MTTPSSYPQPQQPSTSAELHPLLKIAGIVGLALLGVAAVSKIAEAATPPPRLPRRRRFDPVLEAWLQQTDRIATNRRNGRLLERAVNRDLVAGNPEAQVIDQFSVTGPDGRRQVIDHLVVDAKGIVTPYEVKNVGRTRERHLQQAERQHTALKAQGFPVSEKPVLVVRMNTLVKPEHAERADIFRANMRKRKA